MSANTPTPSAGETPILAKLRAFLRVKDTDTLARLQPDSHAIAHSSGSWSNTVSLTWGDLREIERELRALQSAPVGEAAKQPFTLPDYRNAAVAAECGTGAISTAQWLVYELSLDDIGYDAVLIRQSIERLVNEQTRHFQQVVAENEALRKQWADTDENAVRAVKLASAQQDTIATLNKELEGANKRTDDNLGMMHRMADDLAQCQRELKDARGLYDLADAEAKALRSDRDALKARVEELETVDNQLAAECAETAALHATITALRPDAERWRKFKFMTKEWAYEAIQRTSLRYGEGLDEAIDAQPNLAPAPDGKTGGENISP